MWKSCFADLSLLSELKVTTEKLAVTWCKLNHRKADSRKKCGREWKKSFVYGEENRLFEKTYYENTNLFDEN